MLWLLCVVALVVLVRWQWRRRDFAEPRAWWLSWLPALPLLAAAILLLPPLAVLERAFALLVMPTGLVWIGLMVAAWAARETPRLRLGLLGLLLAYTAAGNVWLGSAALRLLEHPFGQIDPLADDGRYDAVVVLGGGTALGPKRRGSDEARVQLGGGGDRLRLAQALWRDGRTQRLVATGSGFPGMSEERDLGAESVRLWQQMGVDRRAVATVPGHNTSSEAAAVAALVQEQGWQRVGLVTSAWHMRRGLARLRDHGVEAQPLPADFRSAWPGWALPNLVPQDEGFLTVQTACWEFVGLLVGR